MIKATHMRQMMTHMAKSLRVLLMLFVVVAFTATNIQAARVTGSESSNGGDGTQTPAESAPGQEGDNLIQIDFTDTEIAEFVKYISEITGKNFVLDSKVRGKITIMSPKKVTPEEAYQVFLSVLEVYGYATVQVGTVTKVVPGPEAKTKNPETRLYDHKLSESDKVVTQLISMDYAKVEDVVKLFQPMISKGSLMAAYSPTNTLIVTDVESNIQRLVTILRAIDIHGVGEELTVIPLQHAGASEMAKLASTLFESKGETASRPKVRTKSGNTSTIASSGDVVKIVADERTNSLIILASKDDTEAIMAFVDLLDKEQPTGEGKIQVVYLQNATAEEVVKVLQALPGKQTDTQNKAEAPVVSKDVQISADKATNSIIIVANKEDFAVLRDVIEKLDIPRSMVYIEALIMEVSTDKAFDLGVEWRLGDNFEVNGDEAVGFMGSGGAGSEGAYSLFPSNAELLAGAAGFPAAFSAGVIGENIKIGGVIFPTIGAVLQAYKNDSDVHILSAPHILATNNEESEIYVGKNVPYVTRQDTSSSSVDYTSYEYRDVGVTLKITPQISQERLVRLDVFQEVTRLIESAGTTTQPTTYKRKADTTVIVKDGNTIVIGGLIDESTEGGTYRVPCLGDIPGLGWLFKSTTERREKTNLYVFLTPRIIQTPAEANAISDKKIEAIKNVEKSVIELYGRKPEQVIRIEDYLPNANQGEENTPEPALEERPE
ncbi:MAG: type II secretion system secretin GspD [Desulfatibacillum sp.]|nr:type II secretion system secretin GspD [Desulfatibacillum sp.]